MLYSLDVELGSGKDYKEFIRQLDDAKIIVPDNVFITGDEEDEIYEIGYFFNEVTGRNFKELYNGLAEWDWDTHESDMEELCERFPNTTFKLSVEE